jgi:signal transduction histidine kinase/methyl-accepting chemotaxis protein
MVDDNNEGKTMSKFVGIQKKLQKNVMMLITITLTAVLLLITLLNILTLNVNINKTKGNIEGSLIAKGRLLAGNNSLAMRDMAADNAFSAIQDLAAAALKEDKDIVYSIFMDIDKKPWAYATLETPSGKVENKDPLVDSISVWASKLDQVNSIKYKRNKEEIIEFAGPVMIDNEKAGFIRYGLSTKTMQTAIAEATRNGINNGISIIVWILIIGAVSLISSNYILKRLSSRIIKPIGSLAQSSEVIAQGNYEIAIKPESNDEIGNLAQNFDKMRLTIKLYTEHLQDIIDEKMQQVNDILNNIDQGLFTINFDGTVNAEYSKRANEILKVKDISKHNIQEILRSDSKQEHDFNTWLSLVVARHENQRWKKLVRLCPIHEIELGDVGSPKVSYVVFDYQRILDKDNKLSKLMILARDVTEERLLEIERKEEHLQHENEMKTILGIVNTPPEEMEEFVADVEERILRLKDNVQLHKTAVDKMRKEFPDGVPYVISKEQINILYRDIHTLKGNAGSYGFELMSAIAHHLEDLLDKLKEPVETRRDNTLNEMLKQFEKQEVLLGDIKKKIGQFFGEGENLSVKVPLTRIETINAMLRSIELAKLDPQIQKIINECNKLSWKNFKDITRKYQKVVQQLARKSNKEIEFVVEPEQLLLPPDELNSIGEPILHLIRNAVDHGIESKEIRQENDKKVGCIKLTYTVSEGRKIFAISDDGAGIDCKKVVEKALEKGIITDAQAYTMDQQEILSLIFIPGFSTAESVTDTSGRGYGMDIVKQKVDELKGVITIETQIGSGSTFTISIPETISGLV